MSKQPINKNEALVSVRGKLNSMLGELYAAADTQTDMAQYKTRALAAAATIPSVAAGGPETIVTEGYYAPGDGGGAMYRRHPGVLSVSGEINGTYTGTNPYTPYTGDIGSGLRDGVDNSLSSVWASNSTGASSIKIDLGSAQYVAAIKVRSIPYAFDIFWGANFLTGSTIETSIDNTNWLAPRMLATSASFIDIVTALNTSKTFTTQTGKGFIAGMFVRLVSDAAPSTNYMDGYVSNYSGSTLIVKVTAVFGSGTHADWTIRAQGAQRIGNLTEGLDKIIQIGETTRYIRISRYNEWLAIAEFRAYSTLSTTPGDPNLPRATFQSVDGQWWELVGEGFVNFKSFGLVGDDSTDNMQALLDWNRWARNESEAGRGVDMKLPNGTYRYNPNTLGGTLWLMGIKRLRISGYGAAFKNAYDISNGRSFDKELPFPTATAVNIGATPGNLINSCPASSTTITLSTASEHKAYQAGDWILIGGMNTQRDGYPFNLDHFEFLQIYSKDESAGVLTIVGNTRNDYLSTWPDDSVVSLQIGKARIWNLSTLSTYTQNHDGVLLPWDIDHVYEGFDCSTLPSYEGAFYFSITGKKLRFIDCITAGLSPSIAGYAEFKGCQVTSDSEIDKLVETVLVDGCLVQSTFSLQSSSVEHAIIRNSRVTSPVKAGGKFLTVENSWLDSIDMLDYHYGSNRAVDIRNSLIRNFGLRDYISAGFFQILSPITYSNGTITIPKSGHIIDTYACHPGQACQIMRDNFGYFSGDYGSGIVIAVRDDATYWYIDTNLHFQTLPSYAGENSTSTTSITIGTGSKTFTTQAGKTFTAGQDIHISSDAAPGTSYMTGTVTSYSGTSLVVNVTSSGGSGAHTDWTIRRGCWFALYRHHNLRVINSTGCDAVRQASAAGAKGKAPWEYVEYFFGGAGADSGTLAEKGYGIIEKVEIDVVQTDATVGAKLSLSNAGMWLRDNSGSAKTFLMEVDLTVAGKRVYDWWALNGKTTNDTVKINGSAQTVLPRDHFISETPFTFAFSSVASTRYGRAMVKVCITYDSGLYRKFITSELDGTSNALVELVGDAF